mmetsp:Transcript_73032/g.206977  ORF Transcript_73032/g.206977 Transcript_73032/m.206977 type:complete len:352 (-) Transcript_73032:185-1240(-)
MQKILSSSRQFKWASSATERTWSSDKVPDTKLPEDVPGGLLWALMPKPSASVAKSESGSPFCTARRAKLTTPSGSTPNASVTHPRFFSSKLAVTLVRWSLSNARDTASGKNLFERWVRRMSAVSSPTKCISAGKNSMPKCHWTPQPTGKQALIRDSSHSRPSKSCPSRSTSARSTTMALPLKPYRPTFSVSFQDSTSFQNPRFLISPWNGWSRDQFDLATYRRFLVPGFSGAPHHRPMRSPSLKTSIWPSSDHVHRNRWVSPSTITSGICTRHSRSSTQTWNTKVPWLALLPMKMFPFSGPFPKSRMRLHPLKLSQRAVNATLNSSPMYKGPDFLAKSSKSSSVPLNSRPW